ncbi:hypothetical protein QQF64_027487 [Cirrhinus molitorella]|uniref:Uncharacterized protein n=2 Tax=Cirrhinus molitorella TaxID=172907 RepID=A0ABR3ND52_9TELE|nr:hypothetical protein Q8A67_003805 [Cirrhinus molitorella]
MHVWNPETHFTLKIRYKARTSLSKQQVCLFDTGRIRPCYCNNGSIQFIAVLQCCSSPAADPLSTPKSYSSVDVGIANVLANLLALVHPVPVILASRNTRLQALTGHIRSHVDDSEGFFSIT